MKPVSLRSLTFVIVVWLAVLACNRSQPAMHPFQIPAWTTFPSDDEIVNAIVGTGGSSEARMLAEGAVRDLILPELVATRELATLRARIKDLQSDYDWTREHETTRVLDPAAWLVRIGVRTELSRLVFRSMALSEVRLRNALWPTEPFPEHWSPGADLGPLTVAEVVKEAKAAEKRLDEVTRRYGIIGLGEERSAALIRNSVAVATTGEHSVTYGPVYKVLNERGMGSSPLPAATPY
jgi:hypothetical protein